MPLKILVIGASQGTGALAVKEALSRGHQVTAFARTPQRLGVVHPNLTIVAGDFHEPASVRAAVEGQDAVIITASTTLAGFRKKPDYFSSGTRNTVEAMKASGARRLVILSALGVGDSARLLPAPLRFLMLKVLLKGQYADDELQERLACESGLEWVIARPGGLTNGPARHRTVREKALVRVPSSISRADLAQFLVEACESDAWVNSAVQLGG